MRGLISDGLIPGGCVDERSIHEVEPGQLTGFQQCHFFAGFGGWPIALGIAGWPTPTADDDKNARRTEEAMNREWNRENRGSNLAVFARMLTGWATPTSLDHKDGSVCPNVKENTLLGRQIRDIGPNPSSTLAPTEKPEGFRLNPAFSLWLQGAPAEVIYSMQRAMASAYPARSRSSKHAKRS